MTGGKKPCFFYLDEGPDVDGAFHLPASHRRDKTQSGLKAQGREELDPENTSCRVVMFK